MFTQTETGPEETFAVPAADEPGPVRAEDCREKISCARMPNGGEILSANVSTALI